MTREMTYRTSLPIAGLSLALLLGIAASPAVRAGEADAKSLLKTMSDYMASQNTISFDYDAEYEVVTKDNQRIALASSGTVAMVRPNKISPQPRRICTCRERVRRQDAVDTGQEC